MDNSTVEKIEILIKALGTMVMIPKYKKDPINIGKEEYIGPQQEPILLGEARELALKKIQEQIEKL